MSNKPVPNPDCPNQLRVGNCVAMAHVEDVDATEQFHALPGFDCESRYEREDGITNFAGMVSGRAKLFLALIYGALALTMAAITVSLIKHPTWMTALALLLPIPLSLLGSKFGQLIWPAKQPVQKS